MPVLREQGEGGHHGYARDAGSFQRKTNRIGIISE
jgi:hypothetical protein